MPIFMRIVHATIHANHQAAYFHVNNRPIWKVPQMSNDKHIQFTGTDWITTWSVPKQFSSSRENYHESMLPGDWHEWWNERFA